MSIDNLERLDYPTPLIHKFPEKYPTRDGIAIPTAEIELPTTKLDADSYYETNHHLEFPRKILIDNVILKTLRELNTLQENLPADVHAYLHERYDSPELPTPRQALARIAISYTLGEDRKLGSAKNPRLKELRRKLYHRCLECYKGLSDKDNW